MVNIVITRTVAIQGTQIKTDSTRKRTEQILSSVEFWGATLRPSQLLTCPQKVTLVKRTDTLGFWYRLALLVNTIFYKNCTDDIQTRFDLKYLLN